MLQEGMSYNLEVIQDLLAEDIGDDIKILLCDNKRCAVVSRQVFIDLIDKHQDKDNEHNRQPLRLVHIVCKMDNGKLNIRKWITEEKIDKPKSYGGRKYVKFKSKQTKN